MKTNHISLKICAIILIALTVSCSDNISQIKEGTFSAYQNTTVGRAFDSWSICDETQWSEFETDNGSQIVEYSCTILDSKKVPGIELIQQLMSVQGSEENVDKVFKSICNGAGFAELLLSQEVSECKLSYDRYLRSFATPSRITVQFRVNLDETFDISWAGHEMGEYSSNTDIDINTLVEIIMNEVTFGNTDYDMLNTNTASYASESDFVSRNAAEDFFGI